MDKICQCCFRIIKDCICGQIPKFTMEQYYGQKAQRESDLLFVTKNNDDAHYKSFIIIENGKRKVIFK